MKRASTILLMSLGLASLCSCSIDTSGLGDPMRYDFSFIFLDADGNNLAEGIDIVDQNPRNVPREDATFGVVSDKGTRLDIILSNPGDKYDNNNYREIGFFPDTPYGLPEPETQPYFVYKKVGGISLIAHDFVPEDTLEIIANRKRNSRDASLRRSLLTRLSAHISSVTMICML